VHAIRLYFMGLASAESLGRNGACRPSKMQRGANGAPCNLTSPAYGAVSLRGE
jgi:hypothetical protein